LQEISRKKPVLKNRVPQDAQPYPLGTLMAFDHRREQSQQARTADEGNSHKASSSKVEENSHRNR
jgi:hypothetical protein